MLQTFTQHLELSPETVTVLLSRSLNQFLESPEVNQLLDSLDTALLRETLPLAKSALVQQLPAFYSWLQSELGVQRVPDSPDHTTTWVVHFLRNQETIDRLVELHRPVPRLALERSIPYLVKVLNTVEPIQTRQEWQKAIAVLCMVLVVAAREQEHKTNIRQRRSPYTNTAR